MKILFNLSLALFMGPMSLFPQGTTGDSLHHAIWGVITPYAAATAADSSLRGVRSAFYDGNNREAALGDQSKPHMLNYLPSHHSSHAIPVETATTVAIGTVVHERSYLSSDRREVYSEMQFVPAVVLYNTAAATVSAGASIDLERAGGAVRVPSGKVLVRGCEQQSLPNPGRQYLMLLRYLPAARAFQLMAGYELSGNQVYALDSITRVPTSGAALQHQKVLKSVTTTGPMPPGGGAFALTMLPVSADSFVAQVKSQLPVSVSGLK